MRPIHVQIFLLLNLSGCGLYSGAFYSPGMTVLSNQQWLSSASKVQQISPSIALTWWVASHSRVFSTPMLLLNKWCCLLHFMRLQFSLRFLFRIPIWYRICAHCRLFTSQDVLSHPNVIRFCHFEVALKKNTQKTETKKNWQTSCCDAVLRFGSLWCCLLLEL